MNTTSDSLVIERLIAGGWGIGRSGSLVTLVRGAIPGESIKVHHTQMHRGYQTAVLSSVLTPSSERTVPQCRDYGVCGGCQLQHVDYRAQLGYKQQIIQETLFRIGRIQMDSVPLPIASPTPFHYRSWMRCVVDNHGAVGLYQEGTNRFVETSACLLPVKPLERVLTDLRECLLSRLERGISIYQVELRHSLACEETLLIFQATTGNKKNVRGFFEQFRHLPGVVGQVLYQHHSDEKSKRSVYRYTDGQDSLTERFHDLTFSINDRSFMQAQWPMYEIIGRVLCEWIQPYHGLRVLELYAGIGCLGLILARQGALVTLVEANPYALRDARKAAKTNHIGRSRFRSAKAEAYLTDVQAGDCDVIVLDPPRAGLSERCLGELIRIQAPKILYLSCDIPSLARDLRRLCAGGYRISRLQSFDMFPQTAHLETLVELIHPSPS